MFVIHNIRTVQHETGMITVGYCPPCIYPLSTSHHGDHMWPNLPGLPPPYLHTARDWRWRWEQPGNIAT